MDNTVIYHAFVNTKCIPDDLPTQANPRKVNTNTSTYKGIVKGLLSDDKSFYLNNRGMLLTVKKKPIIDKDKSLISIDFGSSKADLATYGVVDGGHTYYAIKNHRDLKQEQYVHLEIIFGNIDVQRLISACNSSVQVSNTSLLESRNKFQLIKNAVKDLPFSADVAYKQNEAKRIKVEDVIRLLYIFDIKHFDDTKHPVSAYSSITKGMLEYEKQADNHTNHLKQLASLLPTLTKLYDQVELEIATVYKHKPSTFPKGVVRNKNEKTLFYGQELGYRISAAIVLPVIAAFRALLKQNEDGKYIWICDPLECLQVTKSKLINNQNQLLKGFKGNISKLGSSKLTWQGNYQIILNERLLMELSQKSV